MFRGWKNVVEKLVKGPRDFHNFSELAETI